jgi:hypothetical protein
VARRGQQQPNVIDHKASAVGLVNVFSRPDRETVQLPARPQIQNPYFNISQLVDDIANIVKLERPVFFAETGQTKHAFSDG